MRILALDLSSKSTGYALGEKGKLESFGVITQPSNKHYVDRIYNIVDKILDLVKQEKIDMIYCEEVQLRDPDKEFNMNLHTFKTLMYLQARVVCEVHRNFPEVEFDFFAPNEHRSKVGLATGRGITRDMCKAQAIRYARDKYNLEVNDDIADAITIFDAAAKGGSAQSKKATPKKQKELSEKGGW